MPLFSKLNDCSCHPRIDCKFQASVTQRLLLYSQKSSKSWTILSKVHRIVQQIKCLFALWSVRWDGRSPGKVGRRTASFDLWPNFVVFCDVNAGPDAQAEEKDLAKEAGWSEDGRMSIVVVVVFDSFTSVARLLVIVVFVAHVALAQFCQIDFQVG